MSRRRLLLELRELDLILRHLALAGSKVRLEHACGVVCLLDQLGKSDHADVNRRHADCEAGDGALDGLLVHGECWIGRRRSCYMFWERASYVCERGEVGRWVWESVDARLRKG